MAGDAIDVLPATGFPKTLQDTLDHSKNGIEIPFPCVGRQPTMGNTDGAVVDRMKPDIVGVAGSGDRPADTG